MALIKMDQVDEGMGEETLQMVQANEATCKNSSGAAMSILETDQTEYEATLETEQANKATRSKNSGRAMALEMDRVDEVNRNHSGHLPHLFTLEITVQTGQAACSKSISGGGTALEMDRAEEVNRNHAGPLPHLSTLEIMETALKMDRRDEVNDNHAGPLPHLCTLEIMETALKMDRGDEVNDNHAGPLTHLSTLSTLEITVQTGEASRSKSKSGEGTALEMDRADEVNPNHAGPFTHLSTLEMDQADEATCNKRSGRATALEMDRADEVNCNHAGLLPCLSTLETDWTDEATCSKSTSGRVMALEMDRAGNHAGLLPHPSTMRTMVHKGGAMRNKSTSGVETVLKMDRGDEVNDNHAGLLPHLSTLEITVQTGEATCSKSESCRGTALEMDQADEINPDHTGPLPHLSTLEMGQAEEATCSKSSGSAKALEMDRANEVNCNHAVLFPCLSTLKTDWTDEATCSKSTSGGVTALEMDRADEVNLQHGLLPHLPTLETDQTNEATCSKSSGRVMALGMDQAAEVNTNHAGLVPDLSTLETDQADEATCSESSGRALALEMDWADEVNRNNCLLPGLPKDMAIQCLARVPIEFLRLARAVSKAWNEVLRPSNIAKLRREAGLKCDVIFLFVSKYTCGIPNQRCLYVIDPKLLSIYAVPCPDCLLNNEVQFEMIVGVRGEVLWLGRDSLLGSPLVQLFVLDFLRSRWRSLPSMAKLTGGNAGLVTATIGGVAYFAGGWRNGRLTTEAECLDLTTMGWSSLPNRHFQRVYGKGVAMDGHFLVFAGLPKSNPAEQWHPDMGQWQIVEDVWGKDLKVTKRVKMTMVGGHLCTINSDNEMVKFQPSTKSWVRIGGMIPGDVDSLLGVGSQLWAFVFKVGTSRMSKHEMSCEYDTNCTLRVYATNFHQIPIHWEQLPFCITGLQNIISVICVSFKL